MRAWAVHDADAQGTVARIDQSRLEMLQQLWAAILPDPEAARVAALVPHLIVIGASAAPATPQDLAAILSLLTRIAPALSPT